MSDQLIQSKSIKIDHQSEIIDQVEEEEEEEEEEKEKQNWWSKFFFGKNNLQKQKMKECKGPIIDKKWVIYCLSNITIEYEANFPSVYE